MTPIARLFTTTVIACLCLATPRIGIAAEQSAIDRIRATGEIILGVRRDARPHSYLDANGNPAGYTIEVCQSVVGRLRAQLGITQLRMRFVPVDATDRFQAVAEGRIDLLCGAATITLSRREIVDFSIPTFVDGASVLTLTGTSQDFTALAGKRIGVRAATTTEQALIASLRSNAIEAEVHPVADHAEGLRAVETGEIDAYFGDQSILYALRDTSAQKDRLVVAGNTLTLELHGLALPLGDHSFRLEVDRALSQLYTSGRMADIFEATFPNAEPSESIRYIHTFAPVPP
ncbi:MAG TPA: amino acid ABC transporter substrate-binding protein [Thermohalobaculum sp.]|nr:amino acid ABC transporter substrate-binding protein [Thermohalobaculum sp.]